MPFSTMIPAHNPRLDWLEFCLQSVRGQLAVSEHQVCVIDDCSSNGADIERLCERYGVTYVRPDSELGGLMATNLGYQLAEHELVHILHPDDWVLQGFYEAIEFARWHFPGNALYCTSAIVADEMGRPVAVQNLSESLRINTFPAPHHGNPLCVAACVISRDFFLEYGGWHWELYHCADWEYWARATVKGGCVTHDRPLAAWRTYGKSHTNRLARNARNLRNFIRCAEVMSEYMAVDMPAMRQMVAQRALGQAAQFLAAGDLIAAAANEELARELQSQGVPA